MVNMMWSSKILFLATSSYFLVYMSLFLVCLRMYLASLYESVVLLQLCQAVEVMEDLRSGGVVQGVQALAGDGPVQGVSHAQLFTVDGGGGVDDPWVRLNPP